MVAVCIMRALVLVQALAAGANKTGSVVIVTMVEMLALLCRLVQVM